MKKLMIASLGLSLLTGTAMFAQESTTTGDTMKSTKKSKKSKKHSDTASSTSSTTATSK